MVLSQSCAMTGIGLLIGLPLSLTLTIGMSYALYNVVTVQPIVFMAVMATLGEQQHWPATSPLTARLRSIQWSRCGTNDN